MSELPVALLSGAGDSTDSGIPDYRGPDGLWRRDPGREAPFIRVRYGSHPVR